MSKPQKVSRRAASYANAHHGSGGRISYFGDTIPKMAWAAGYRAAMKDVRKIISQAEDMQDAGSDVAKFVSDLERLK